MVDNNALDDVVFSEEKRERREIIPRFAKFHDIPKQIADTCNSIGRSEKLVKNGIPSGVLQPSQIAHDRWLSVGDAFWDAIIMFLGSVVLIIAGINIWTITIIIIAIIYWFFHISWWQKSIELEFAPSIQLYVKQTRYYYWTIFTIMEVILSTIGFSYFLYLNGFSYIQKVIDSIKSLFDGTLFGSKDASQNSEDIFASVLNEDVTGHTATLLNNNKSFLQTIKEIDFSSFHDGFNTFLINVMNSFQIPENQKTYIIAFFIVTSCLFIFTYVVKQYFTNYYLNKKYEHEQNSDEELKYDIESSMEILDKI